MFMLMYCVLRVWCPWLKEMLIGTFTLLNLLYPRRENTDCGIRVRGDYRMFQKKTLIALSLTALVAFAATANAAEQIVEYLF